MILYLHSIYNGGYAIDEMVSEADREIFGDFVQLAELSKNATYIEAVEIAKKYGGLEKLGDKLLTNKDYESAIGEIVWLIVTLANQPILIHNYKNLILHITLY